MDRFGADSGHRGHVLPLDSTGAATVAGWTYSTNFPATPGAYDTSYNGGYDAFVARLSLGGNALVYATYVGGASDDTAEGVTLDTTGTATVAGGTGSANFPTTPGAFDSTISGGVDAFVLRVSPTGNALVYSTYVGGGGYEYGWAIAVDGAGAATVAGTTSSNNFPATVGSYDTSSNGNLDVFVVRLSPTGNALIYATYVGGGSDDVGWALEVDGTGAATVAGSTSSGNFPTTAGAYDTISNGFYDAFVLRLDPAGNALVFATYLGGGSDDSAYAVALDATGAATVTGQTTSSNFPTTPTAYDGSVNGYDAFVARLSPVGSALFYSTYLGGAGVDSGNSVALDASGAATVAGRTSSSDFPTTAGAYDPSLNGGEDAFVARLQISTFAFPVMAFPAAQSVPVGGIYGLQVSGPAGATVALMFDMVPVNIPCPPYGTIGVQIPPMWTLDGIGLGFPASIPSALSISASGILYYSCPSVPPSFAGLTYYAQAVASHASLPPLPPFGGIGVSTHGDSTLPTPACQVTFVP